MNQSNPSHKTLSTKLKQQEAHKNLFLLASILRRKAAARIIYVYIYNIRTLKEASQQWHIQAFTCHQERKLVGRMLFCAVLLCSVLLCFVTWHDP
jgi:hypothetical protein